MMERLRKVHSFSELRIGQIVVLMNCKMCRAPKCRAMLTNYKAEQGSIDPITLQRHVGPAFAGLPNCNPGTVFRGNTAITPTAVSEGRLFIVEDGLETAVRELADAKATP